MTTWTNFPIHRDGTIGDPKTEESREISSEYIICTSCGHIAKTEDCVNPHLGNLVSCPACTDLGVIEYEGPTTVEIPVDLLSDIRAKLNVASFMLGDPRFSDDCKKAHRDCTQVVLNNLWQFIEDARLMDWQNPPKGDQLSLDGLDKTDHTPGL